MLRTLMTRFEILTHHLLERSMQGNRILVVGILGNRVSLETIVLRIRPTRFYILTHHFLESRIQDNLILGNRILGNRLSLESIVLRLSLIHI